MTKQKRQRRTKVLVVHNAPGKRGKQEYRWVDSFEKAVELHRAERERAATQVTMGKQPSEWTLRKQRMSGSLDNDLQDGPYPARTARTAPTVLCRWCGNPVQEARVRTGRDQCFDCWQLLARIADRPEVAARILASLPKHKPRKSLTSSS